MNAPKKLEPPDDVLLHVPKLRISQIDLKLGDMNVTLKGVEADAQLSVRHERLLDVIESQEPQTLAAPAPAEPTSTDEAPAAEEEPVPAQAEPDAGGEDVSAEPASAAPPSEPFAEPGPAEESSEQLPNEPAARPRVGASRAVARAAGEAIRKLRARRAAHAT
jgi:uncharacterized membrane-anchored protein